MSTLLSVLLVAAVLSRSTQATNVTRPDDDYDITTADTEATLEFARKNPWYYSVYAQDAVVQYNSRRDGCLVRPWLAGCRTFSERESRAPGSTLQRYHRKLIETQRRLLFADYTRQYTWCLSNPTAHVCVNFLRECARDPARTMRSYYKEWTHRQIHQRLRHF